MAIFRRRREGPALSPAASPQTVIGLLAWAAEDWDRARRLITIVGGLSFIFIIGCSLGIGIILAATEEIGGSKLRYIVPPAVWAGASLLSFLVAVAGGITRKMRQRRAGGQTPPGRR